MIEIRIFTQGGVVNNVFVRSADGDRSLPTDAPFETNVIDYDDEECGELDEGECDRMFDECKASPAEWREAY